ncbi:kinase-like domain-containing protein [Cyathus striatus]|nr:kinase-like domain-containing protein [Cyathus striatus]
MPRASVPEANPLGDRPSLTSDGFKIICHAEACTGNAEVIRPCCHIKSSSNIYAVADPPSCVIQQPLSAGRATPAEVLDPPVREGDEDEEQEYATGVSQSVEYEEKFTVGIASYSPLDVQDPFIVVKKVLDVPVPNLGRRVWMTDVSATYSYEKLLGVGAYGAVSQYAVVGGDQRMPRVVAVKKMKYDDLAEKEVHLTKAMNWSEWVVMAFGGVVYKGEMFMVMDSCVGTLHDLNAEASSFPRDLAMFYIAETIVALRVLHRSRIIHRDVKPENMFITPSFHIAIGDFGIAHQFALPSEQDLLSSSEFSNWSTAYLEDQSRIQEDQLDLYTFPFLWAEDNPWTVNISCGTSVYAAPEVMRREYHSFGADLYSVGVITHLLLCGDFPYVDLANVEVYPGEPEFRVLQLDKSLTVIEKDFIARMLDPSTENRLSYKQIHDHRIFDKINWEAIELQTVIPPLQEYYKMLDDEHAE